MKKDEDIKISVVTVTLNCAVSIEKTIGSVLNQSYNNIEYIIVDGLSNDGTLDIVHKYSDKIDFLISEKDSGIYNAMNKAVKIATGDYIYFLNSDDYFADAMVVANVAHAIRDNQGIDMVYGDVVAHRGDEVFHCHSPKVLDRKALCQGSFCHQALFARREVLLKTGGFSEEYKVAADVDWLTRSLASGCKALHVGQDIAVVSLEGLSGSADWRHEKKKFLKSNYSFFERLFWRKIPKLLKIT